MAEPVTQMPCDIREAAGSGAESLTIGLVNAMSDAALAVAEQRFLRLIQAAFPDRAIKLRCTTLPQIARGEMAAARIARHYVTLEAFVAAPPDMVVFSGAEPVTSDLRNEVFWPGLTALFDWVRADRIPSVFSCLAAHAAVLHYDGVERRRLPRKVFGVFAQTRAQTSCDAPALPQALLRGLPDRTLVAHSRWNEVTAGDLAAAGYCVLTQSGVTGVDAFVPCTGLPQLFLQGHPEYEAGALEAEYRRDMRRFEAGALPAPPARPDYRALQAQPGASPMAAALDTTRQLHLFAENLVRNWMCTQKEMQG